MTRPSGTVTFLMTDIEGSTRLWEAHRDAMGTALAIHDSILKDAVAAHDGTVVKSTGDGLLAVFSKPDAAMKAAAEGQRALARQPWGTTGQLRVRMAVHTGNAEPRGGDYYGPPVNRVARLLAVGHGNQVLVSGATEALSRDVLPASFELVDRGEHRLRDLDRPEQVFQLVAPDLPRDFPALRSLGAFRTNLSSQLTSFVGRERELAEVRALTDEHRLVCLIGTGGTGKTRLMLQVGSDLLDRYVDGVWLVELAAITDPALIAQEVAAALGFAEEPGRGLLESLTDYLRSKAMLLLVDNCEHLIAGAANLVDALLTASPGLVVIASSREALGVPGEIVFQVPSLGLPVTLTADEHEETPTARFDAIAASESVRLFLDRATAALPSFRLTPANAPAVAEICQRLDGIPLAIELAAVRVTVLSVDEVAQKLGDRFRLLTGGRRTALPRQQTLQALIDWSWDLLSDDDRRLLARLSVFAGGWTLDAAAAITGPNGAGAPVPPSARADADADAQLEALEGLTRLVDRSLIIVEHAATTRYRMLETVRQYARDRLAATGEAVALRDRHLAFFLALAVQAGPALIGPKMLPALARLDAEIDNLRAALEWSFEASPERALRLSAALMPYWRSRALGFESTERLGRAAELAQSLPPPDPITDRERAILHASVLAAAEVAFATAGIASSGLGWAERAVEIARGVGDPETLAYALGALVMGIVFSGQALEGDLSAELDELLERTENWWMIAMMGGGAAMGSLAVGDPADAEAWVARATEAANRTGNAFAIAFAALSRGRVSGALGRLDEARRWFGEAIAAYEEIGDRRFVVVCRSDLAHALRRAGENDEAEALYRQTIHAWQHLGNRGAIANQLEGFAFLAAARGDEPRAARLFGAAEATRELVGAAMMPYERPEYEAEVRRLREGTQGPAVDSAWAEGRRLKLDDAVSLAL
ncbi:MAG: tetratricopeptide repeat protein [Chloroflexota bacterium]|nr:tetratricopeptide repeat protein [Chloroflexota bacterium]